MIYFGKFSKIGKKNFKTSIRPLVDPQAPFDVFLILLSFLPFVILKHHRQLVV